MSSEVSATTCLPFPGTGIPLKKILNGNTKNGMQKTELIFFLPGMWFTLECLPSMCKALSSSPNDVKQKQKKEFIASHEQWTMAQRTMVPSTLRLTLFYFLSLWKKKLFSCHFSCTGN